MTGLPFFPVWVGLGEGVGVGLRGIRGVFGLAGWVKTGVAEAGNKTGIVGSGLASCESVRQPVRLNPTQAASLMKRLRLNFRAMTAQTPILRPGSFLTAPALRKAVVRFLRTISSIIRWTCCVVSESTLAISPGGTFLS